jgi:NADPH:quinone reductase-like Zn-dependent oxidoreductase
MKAMIWTKYGPPDVLQPREVEKPIPKDNEILVKINATTVMIGDCELRALKIPILYQIPLRIILGITKPKRVTVLGQELSGDVEAVGKEVTRFKIGDPIFAPTLLHLSTYAEYTCLPEQYAVYKPASISYEEATTIPTGGIYGLHLVREANLRPGQKVLICGAGGTIGTYALQIAKSFGADVTCVDSAAKLDLLRSIGANHVIDYTKENFTRSGQKYNAIIDVVGKSSYSGSIRCLKPSGHYVLGNPGIAGMLRGRWTSMTTDKRVLFETAGQSAEAYAFLIQLIEAGKVKPIIDRRYPLEQIAEAHRYVDTGQKKGNVVITVRQS